MIVDLFITCLNDALFPQTGQATVALLTRLGHTVKFDPRQTCCGQMHFNTGYQVEAVAIIRKFVEVYRDKEIVVSPSGSCVGMIREMFPKAAEWAGDSKLKEEVETLGRRVFELSEFLVNVLRVEDVGAYYPHRVTFHPTCHSLRLIKVGDAPKRLLNRVKDLELVELGLREECCGFGGTFSVKNPETSTAMLSDKIKNILDADVEVCVAGDNSCLMHIGGGLRKMESGVKTVHLAEILASTEDSVRRLVGGGS